MNKKDEIKNKKKFAAIDLLIIILLVVCLAGIVIRIAVGENLFFQKDSKGEYTVSYVVYEEADEYSNLFSSGKEFYLENGEYFGKLSGNATFTPAEIHSQNSRGEYVHGYADDGTVDIKGSFTVEGTMTETGFLLNANTYIAPNMTITVSSSDITVELLITDIAKAQ